MQSSARCYLKNSTSDRNITLEVYSRCYSVYSLTLLEQIIKLSTISKASYWILLTELVEKESIHSTAYE